MFSHDQTSVRSALASHQIPCCCCTTTSHSSAGSVCYEPGRRYFQAGVEVPTSSCHSHEIPSSCPTRCSELDRISKTEQVDHRGTERAPGSMSDGDVLCRSVGYLWDICGIPVGYVREICGNVQTNGRQVSGASAHIVHSRSARDGQCIPAWKAHGRARR